jgi:hypothetical protein
MDLSFQSTTPWRKFSTTLFTIALLTSAPSCTELATHDTLQSAEGLPQFAPQHSQDLRGLYHWNASWWPGNADSGAIRSRGTCRFVFDPRRDLLVGEHAGELFAGAFCGRLILGPEHEGQLSFWSWENPNGDPVLDSIAPKNNDDKLTIRRISQSSSIEEQLITDGSRSLEYRQFRLDADGTRFLFLRLVYRRP